MNESKIEIETTKWKQDLDSRILELESIIDSMKRTGGHHRSMSDYQKQLGRLRKAAQTLALISKRIPQNTPAGLLLTA